MAHKREIDDAGTEKKSGRDGLRLAPKAHGAVCKGSNLLLLKTSYTFKNPVHEGTAESMHHCSFWVSL